jgi:hypothetical protein
MDEQKEFISTYFTLKVKDKPLRQELIKTGEQWYQ